MSQLNELTDAIKGGKNNQAKELVEALLAAKAKPAEILGSLIAGMDYIGQKFKNNEVYVPEVLIAARAMKTAMGILEPVLVAAGIRPEHKVVIGTVKGDLHDIGKNLVAMMLKGANFEVIDVGVDVTPEKFIAAAKDNGADIVAMSALLTTTMPFMRETVDAIKKAGLSVKTMIGGAPVTQEYADEIGANGYSSDAASAVDLAKKLCA
ncbi:MAG TPA: corrinoid protein [Phycisphaerae bacterium]|nr:corrinoid protein [Phycisphaerae bacterium]HPS52574.1 corrinoid protein [Phycisphaerae bacterium]